MTHATFDAAVQEALQILQQIDTAERGQIRIGELADELKIEYGAKDLKRFARKIGVRDCTVERYRSTFRAWKEISASGLDLTSVSYSVLRALAAHPDRAEIVRNNPAITQSAARQLVRAFHGEQRQAAIDAGAEDDEKADIYDEEKSWRRNLLLRAKKGLDGAQLYGDWSRFDVDEVELRAVEQTAEAWIKLRDHLKQQHLKQQQRDQRQGRERPVERPVPHLPAHARKAAE